MGRFVVALLLLMMSAVFPQTVRAYTLSVEVKDKYVVGKGIRIYDGPVIQTDLLFNLPRGFYFDLWWSTSLNNSNLNGDFGDEVDYTIGWAGKVKNFNLDLGVAYFDLIKLFSLKGGDVVRPYLDLGRDYPLNDRHTFTPYVRAEVMIPVGWEGSVDARKGAHLFGGVNHRWQIHERISVNQKLSIMYDTGTFVASDHGFLGHYDFALGWKITNSVTINLPTLKLIFPISDLNDGRKTEYVIGVGVTLMF